MSDTETKAGFTAGATIPGQFNGLSDSAASIGRSLNEAVETRFCVNCRWINDPAAAYPRCEAPQNFHTVVSMVDGRTRRTRDIEYCEIQRESVLPERCGASGRWFQPREEKQ